jgi:3-deoxy-D-manno-octulosonate 8-phosphate phosphatase (KDO 8-P phosphatase)
MSNYKELLSTVNTFIFDYDGVFTGGTVFLMNTGEPLRTANVKDGYAIQLANKKGYRIVIISGGRSESVINRFKLLKIKDVFLGVENKFGVYKKYIADNNLKPENVLYMGDDIPDYEVMKKVGVATCPADAAEEIKEIVHYISHLDGGEGCIRDVIEQVLKVQGKWMNDDAYRW